MSLPVFSFLLTAALVAAPCAPVVDVRGPGLPAALVADFADEARAALVDVRARLGSTDCAPLTVTLVPQMRDAPVLDPPWHLPSWAAGGAMPGARRIVVAVTAEGAPQDRHTTLVHEVAHVVTAEVIGGRALPRWLDEGIARVVAGEHGVADVSLLAHARVVDRFLPLAALEHGFPPGAADAALAYAEAGRAVSLLQGAAGGGDALPRLLVRVAAGDAVDDALVAVAGRASWQLDADMRRSLSGWAALAVVGVETDVAMAACAAVVAVVGVRARRRLRRRIEAMDDPGPGGPAVVLARFVHGPVRGASSLARAVGRVGPLAGATVAW
jgi:hypothetical protein